MQNLSEIEGSWTVSLALKRYPEAVSVFRRFSVDSCCFDSASIADIAVSDGIGVEVLLEAIRARARQPV